MRVFGSLLLLCLEKRYFFFYRSLPLSKHLLLPPVPLLPQQIRCYTLESFRFRA